MGKILTLLLCLVVVFGCAAQQKDIDSFARELKKHPQLDSVHTFLLWNLAHSYLEVDPAKGVGLATEAVLLAKKLNSPTLLEGAYGAKAANYLREGLYDSSIYYYQATVPICEKLNDQQKIAAIYVNMGTIYWQKSDYASALINANKALTFFEDKHDTSAMALIYGNIALAYAGLSDYTKALDYQLKCLRIYEISNDPDALAQCYVNLIEVYRGLANYPVALQYAKKAVVISEKAGNNYAITMANAAEGQIYFYMGKPAESIDYYLLALKQTDKYNFINNKAILLQMAANSYLILKRYAEAFDYCEQSDSLLKSLGDQINLSISYDLLGQIYLASPAGLLSKKGIAPNQRIATALTCFDSSLAIARQIGAKEKAQAALTDMSEAYKSAGNYEKALDAFKQAMVYKDSIINDDKKKQVTRLEMQYEFDRREDAAKAENDKKQALAAAEIKQQQTIRNAVIAGAALLVIAAAVVFVFYKKRKDANMQRQEAELRADIAKTEMKALRAQMTPHFIFNSLNSIADYIDKHETDTATEFTVKFAHLMRMVLENSERKEVTLQDDLRALELYMQLERMRMNGKFSFEIRVDEAIERENTLIPPLLLQPFVENSIWHGISKKSGQGNILVSIKKEGDAINCIIDDDGVGLNPLDNQPDEKKHLGMKITKARIDILNKLKKANATVKVFNKEEGVRAELRLPLELAF